VVVKVQAIVVAVVAELVSSARDGREEWLSWLCLPEIEVQWKEVLMVAVVLEEALSSTLPVLELEGSMRPGL
jgi:hypothetical protein